MPECANAATRSHPFGTTRCAGRSALSNCKRRAQWITSQDGENPMASCGVHLSWLIRLRTAPGASIKVTRVSEADLKAPAAARAELATLSPATHPEATDG